MKTAFLMIPLAFSSIAIASDKECEKKFAEIRERYAEIEVDCETQYEVDPYGPLWQQRQMRQLLNDCLEKGRREISKEMKRYIAKCGEPEDDEARE